MMSFELASVVGSARVSFADREKSESENSVLETNLGDVHITEAKI